MTLAVAVFLTLALFPPLPLASAPQAVLHIRGNEVAMGGSVVSFSDLCLTFGSLLSAGDFFDGLQITQTPKGRQYRKGKEAVFQYPPRLDVNILVWAFRCGSGDEVERQRVEQLLNSFNPTAYWKSGLQTRPVRKLTFSLIKPTIEQIKGDPATKKLEKLGLEMPTENLWQFKLVIEDAEVPLENSLIVVLSSSDGKQVTRFSARL